MNTLEMLERLVGFPTVSSETNLPLIDFVARYLEQFGVKSHVLPSPCGKKANLWATLGPAQDGGLVLSGHTDVVPVQGQPWRTPPFAMQRDAERAYGRGTTDMKGFLACVLAAMPSFVKAPLRTPIHLALTYDEEVGCFGADHLVAEFGRSLPRPAMAIVGEPSNMQAIIGHKGLRAYDTTVQGRDAHSSLAHLGASAVRAAADITTRLYQMADELALGATSPGMQTPAFSTINVGKLQGGQARNIIARQASAVWEYRFIAGAQEDWAISQINAHIEKTVLPRLRATAPDASVHTEKIAQIPAFYTHADAPVVQLVSQLMGSVTTSGVPYAAEAGQFQAAGVSTVICGPGSIEQAHQCDEYIAVSELDLCDAMMARLATWAQTTQPGSNR